MKPKTEAEQNAAIEKKIKELRRAGLAEFEAQEAAPILLGLSPGDVVELDPPQSQ